MVSGNIINNILEYEVWPDTTPGLKVRYITCLIHSLVARVDETRAMNLKIFMSGFPRKKEN